MRHRQTHGREACTLLDPPRKDLPQRQRPVAGRPQRRCDPQASRDGGHSPDRPKGHPLLQRDRIWERPQGLQRLLVAQRQPQCLDLRRGTMPHMGKRAVEDLAVRAIRLTQQMSRRRFATTGDMRGIALHSGYHNSIYHKLYKCKFSL